ncbi:MAG: hypothetical protein KIT68_10700, partial [Phycisphaeraceae bacterium]|nr:hypothetical protein [Phycisphaeraceae bacterium]
TLFSIERADLDRLLVDPKDAALKAALKMLPARLRELPGDIPELRQVPPGVFDLIDKCFGRSARFAATYDQKNQQGGFFGAGLVLSIGAADEKDAREIHGIVAGLLKSLGDQAPPTEDSTAHPGMTELPTPVGVVRFGPRRSADGWRYEIHVGGSDPDGAFSPLRAITMQGASAFLRTTFDGAPLTPLFEMLVQMAGGEAEGAVKQLEDAGLIGPNAVRYETAWGHTDAGFRSTSRAVGMGKVPAAAAARAALSDADLRLLPADTVLGSLAKFDPQPAIAQLQQVIDSSQEAQEAIAQIRGALGVDPVEDVLKTLGDVVAVYLSDSTGGGTIGSGVLVIGLKDAAKLSAANKRLVGRLNAELAKEHAARGYVRVKAWKHDGVEFHTLQTPGLPVPLEPTYCISDRYLVVALTPQAAIAAVRQAAGKGDGGLLAGPAGASFPSGRKFSTISFTHAPRMLQRGYPLLSMSGSFLANGLRSRTTDRDPGLIVPTYADLAKGVAPAVGYAYWDGDDYVTERTGDRSLLVNLGVALGTVSEFAPVIAGALAVAAGAQNSTRAARQAVPPPPPPPPPGEREDKRPNFMLLPAGGNPDDDVLPPAWPGGPFESERGAP